MSQWNNLKFDPRHPKTREPVVTKIGTGDLQRCKIPIKPVH